ncbi:MAG: hypothetical protein RBR02_04570 [Desulfuromonadaceae bacterium]|nr:hypothetical protein [Desulfuromonadaceae bacterium]
MPQKTLTSENDALRYWNSPSGRPVATSAKFIRHDDIFLLRDSNRRVVGALTPERHILDPEALRAYRIMSHGR